MSDEGSKGRIPGGKTLGGEAHGVGKVVVV